MAKDDTLPKSPTLVACLGAEEKECTDTVERHITTTTSSIGSAARRLLDESNPVNFVMILLYPFTDPRYGTGIVVFSSHRDDGLSKSQVCC